MDHNEMEQALKEVKAGDIDQFGLIIDAMQKPLFVYCYHMLGHRQEAEDAVQEVFLKAFEQLYSYRHTVSFSACLESCSDEKRVTDDCRIAENLK
ncbi:hypothetical protein EMIT07CA2_40541 [Brevibacillus sp. IT-7CA2]|uniref:sigma factor n=1 Tax=Brevibacillus sp. IT-7CA2 TaxID=3026436 RepID=UPI0039E0A2C6